MPQPPFANLRSLDLSKSPSINDAGARSGHVSLATKESSKVVQIAEVLEALQSEQAGFQRKMHDWISRFGDEMQFQLAAAITKIPASTAFQPDGQKDVKDFANIDATDHVVNKSIDDVNIRKTALLDRGASTCQANDDDDDACYRRASHSSSSKPNCHRQSKAAQHVVVNKILSPEGQEEILEKIHKHDNELEERESKWTSRIVLHPFFNIACSAVIFGNSLLVGVSTQYGTHHEARSDLHELVGYFFSAFFLVELLLRMDTSGFVQYFIGDDCYWNIFDFLLVAMSIADFVWTLTVADANLSGSFKTLKAVRIARAFRVFRFFNELSMLVILIANSVKSLIWALVMLSIIIYVFSILLTQNATHFVRTENSLPPEKIRQYFGDIQTSVYTLVLSTLDGLSWVEVSDVCLDMGVMSTVSFFSYICFAHLAVLNIITAVFVDHAMERAKSERELLIQKELDNKAALARQLIDIFNEMDADHSGEISWEELTSFFEDERARAHFEALGLSTDDLKRLWALLDHDAENNVHLHEFLEGCMHLKGVARSIDMQSLARRIRKIEKRLVKLVDRLSGDVDEAILSRTLARTSQA